MSHEVVQINKLVKYNRKSHEMMRVTCKCIPTTVIHKNKHSHEVTRFWNRIAVWSSPHEQELFHETSHGSVFESPMYRVNNEHESGSGLGLLLSSSDCTNESGCCN